MKEPQNNPLHSASKNKETIYLHGQKIMMKYDDKSDFDVWSSFKLGDEAAFNYIYRKYMHGLYNYAYQISRDQDIARNAIHTLFIRIRNKRKGMADVQNIKAYLMKIMYRIVLDELEKKKRKSPVLKDDIDKSFSIELSPETKLINYEISEERRKKLEKALSQLTEKQKEAILLMYKEDLSYKEIAEIMGFEQVKTARKLIYRAISNLKDFLLNKA